MEKFLKETEGDENINSVLLDAESFAVKKRELLQVKGEGEDSVFDSKEIETIGEYERLVSHPPMMTEAEAMIMYEKDTGNKATYKRKGKIMKTKAFLDFLETIQ